MSVIMMNGFDGGQHSAASNNSTSANNNSVLHIKREPVENNNSFVEDGSGGRVGGGGGGSANSSANHTPSQIANSVSSVSSSASERMRSSSSEPQIHSGISSTTTPVWSPSVHPAYADFDNLYASQLNGNLGSAAAAAAAASCCLGPPLPSSNGNGSSGGLGGLSAHNNHHSQSNQGSQHGHHAHQHHLSQGSNAHSYSPYASYASSAVAAAASQHQHDGILPPSSSSSVASVVSRPCKPSAAKFWSNSYDSMNGSSPPMPSSPLTSHPSGIWAEGPVKGSHSSIMAAAAVCHPSAFAAAAAHHAAANHIAASAWCGYPTYTNAAGGRGVASVDPYLADPDPRSAFVDSASYAHHTAMRMSAVSADQSCGGPGGSGGSGGLGGGSVTPVTSWPQSTNGIPSSSTSNSTSKWTTNNRTLFVFQL